MMPELTSHDSIPTALRSRSQWVVWRYEQRGDAKPTKVPRTIDGAPASTTGPGTWCSFAQAVAAAPRFDGVGFVFTATDPWVGVDIDNCFAEDGTLLAWAVDLVSLAQGCEAYIERTPSGKGLHVIGVGALPGRGRKITGLGADGRGAVELYDRDRYFTVTGDQTDLGDVSGDLGALLAHVWTRYELRDDADTHVEPGVEVQDARADELTRMLLAGSRADFLGLWNGVYDAAQHGADRSRARMSLLTQVALKLSTSQRVATPAEVRAVALRSPFIRQEMQRHKWPRLAGEECARAVAWAAEKVGHVATMELSPPDAPAVDADGVIVAAEPQLPPPSAQAFVLGDPSAIEPRDWLYKRTYIRGYVTGTFAPGAAAKTQMSLKDTVTMCAGFDLDTREPLKRGPLRVWYINVEDDLVEIQRRLAAICLHYNVTNEDLGGRLFVDTDREGRYIVAETTKAGVVVREAVVDALLGQVHKNRIDVVMVDPLVGMHAVNENNNPEMNRVIAQLRRVGEQGRCGVHIVHHVRKGTDGEEVSAEDGRGASAIKDACRAIRTLTPMSEKEAADFGIPQDKRRFYIWANPSGKPNLAPPVSVREWVFLKDVGLGNGREDREEDRIGVPIAWKTPSPFEGVSLEDCGRIWARIAATGRPLDETRESSRAAAWVGYLVCDALGWGRADAGSIAQAARIVDAWKADGVLVEYVVRDSSKARDVKCVRLGPGALPGL